MKFPKILTALIVTTSLISPTLAEDIAPASVPLPAGKAAGTHEAALLALGPIFWIGLAAVIAGVAAAASSGGKSSTTTTGTSS